MFENIRNCSLAPLITAAPATKARTVFVSSHTEVVRCNSLQGIDICVHIFSVLLYCVRRGFATGLRIPRDSAFGQDIGRGRPRSHSGL
jgi:hypothetical protein